MNKEIKMIILSLAIFSLCCGLWLLPSNTYSQQKPYPQEGYRVYYKDKILGDIKLKEELFSYINSEEQELKRKYNVTTVYIPDYVKLEPIKEYKLKLTSAKSIYDKIKVNSSFMIDGYKVTIEGARSTINEDTSQKDDSVIYIKDKKVLEEALQKVTQIFVNQEEYNNYINGIKLSDKKLGKYIESLTNENKILYQKAKIPTDKKIFLESEELTRYLLFGNLNESSKYIVKSSENINEIAYNNKLSVDELLLINPNISDANKLLYPGEILNVTPLQSLINIEEKSIEKKYQDVNYESKVEYDDTKNAGYRALKQKGEKGQLKATYRYTYVNRRLQNIEQIESETIKVAKPEIYVLGSKPVFSVAIEGFWHFPTIQPYSISSGYGYRFGRFHYGNDIILFGNSLGAPIFAANNGTVARAGYSGALGNYVEINHNNGIWTAYYHMIRRPIVNKGEAVERGQVIGYIGSTGDSTGPHLHFGAASCSHLSSSCAFNSMELFK